MATGSTAPRHPVPADQHADLIDRQLGIARRQVKLTDLMSRAMLLVIGVLSFLLAVTLLDHWVIDLGSWGRSLALIALLSGVVIYAMGFLLPLVMRRINPVFAARAIEQHEPALKNSLINFLTFRRDERSHRSLVFLALQRKAATDLAAISVDDAVDRRTTLKIGYALAAIVTLMGVYKILSPKDPFQSISRVAVPWKNIERPARASILAIREHHRAELNGPIRFSVPPGERAAYQGHFVTIAAGISGIGRNEPVTLQYASVDGQLVDQTLAMDWNTSTQQREATLPSTSEGMQLSLAYSIQAGDVTSQQYVLEVTPAPVITVERLDYVFPAYTRLPDQTVVGDANIQAVEGTRITVHGHANQPIQSAFIELITGIPDAPISPRAMRCDQDRCERSFRLPSVRSGKVLPREYGIRFYNFDGEPNRETIRHRIDVLSDIAPEIEMLVPTSRTIELPEDGEQKIEVRALDPDYGLRRVRLRAAAGSESILSQDLVDDAQGRTGQVVSSYQFIPRKLGLRSGDQVTLWALAEDNRADPETGEPRPNTRPTPRYRIHIVPAATNAARTSEKSGQTDSVQDEKNSSDVENQSADQDSGDSSDSPTASKDGSAAPEPTDAKPEQADGQQDSDSDSDSPEQASESNSDAGSEEETTGDSNATGSPTSGSPPTGPDDSAGSPPADEGDGTSAGEGGSSTDSTGTSAPPDGEATGGADGGRPHQRPPSHDGEVVERVLEHLREQADAGTDPGNLHDSADPRSESGPPSDTTSDDRHPAGDEPAVDPSQTSPQSDSGEADPADRKNAPTPGEAGAQQTPASGDSTDEGVATPPEDGSPGGSKQPPTRSRNDGASNKSQAPATDTNPGASKSPSGEQNQKQPGSNRTDSKRPVDRKPQTDPQQAVGDSSDEATNNPADHQETSPDKRSQDVGQPPRSDPTAPGEATPDKDPSAGATPKPGASPSSTDNQRDGEQTDGPTERPSNASTNQQDRAGDAQQRSSEGSDGNAPANGQNQPPSEPGEPNQSQLEQPGEQRGQPHGNPQGGGIPSNSQSQSGDGHGEVAGGDQPNLEYARKATDLVLEKLADQQENPDPKLLKKLNWSEEDIKQFVRRWKQLKQNAATPTGKHEFQQALRSLGLKTQGTRVKQQTRQTEKIGRLRDPGGRFAPPPGLRKKFNAYKRSVSRTPNESP